jgi:hypothetical protein
VVIRAIACIGYRQRCGCNASPLPIVTGSLSVLGDVATDPAIGGTVDTAELTTSPPLAKFGISP